MIQSHLLNRFDEVKEADALFKGSESLGHSGYWPLGHPEAKTGTLPLPPSELYPGLIECMGACLSFTQVFTHGDLGIYEKAYTLVNNQDPANVIRVEGQKIAPRPGIKKILVTGVHKTYDSEALEWVLSACREKYPQLTVYLFRGERIEPKLDKKFGVQHLEYNWAKYLEAEEFHRKYYRQRLARLYKETRDWPRVPDFQNREEFDWLEKAVNRYRQVHIYGGPGVGKTALLAKLADKLAEKSKNQKNQSVPVVWVNLETPAVTRAEVLISMGLQLGLEEPLRLLEHKDPKGQLETLEKKIQRKIETEKILVIIDSLEAIFRPGRIGVGDPELQKLLAGWAEEKLTIGKLSGPTRQPWLVFTGDIRDKEEKNFYKPLKNALTRVIKEENQKIGVQKLSLEKQEEMLMGWLGSVVPAEITPQNRQELRRLLQLAGGNLRILRFLAIWAVGAGGIAPILPHLEPIEKAEPWRKENLVIAHCFKKLRPREQLILEALEGIGRPIHRQVICSTPGMEASLSALIQARLVIYNKEDKTYEPLYRYGREQGRRKTPVKVEPAQERSLKKSRDGAILNCKLLGGITEPKISTAAGYYRAGAALCEQAGDWELWEDAPLIDFSGLVAKARYFLKIAKNTTQEKSRKKFAAKALELAERSLKLGIKAADSHFIGAQALDILYPRTHEKEIEAHYEKTIALDPYPDKLYGYARYINRRYHDRERAELKFKEAGRLEEKRGRFNVIGMHSFAEFYLGWPGHEKEAGEVLNRIIAGERNKTRNYFLAARLYQEMGWRYLSAYFYEAVLKEDPKNIQVLNSYANASAEWGDRPKAQELFERLRKIDDKHVPTLNSYANACAEWGEKEKAIDLFERALAIDAKNVQVLNSYGKYSAEWGNKEKAHEMFERALAIDGKNVQVLNSYANACAEWGDKEKAKELFERSLQIDAKHVPTLNSYANASAAWGEKEKAQELFERALAIDPKHIQSLNSYGKYSAEWGEKEKAKELFEKALALEPGNIIVINSYRTACTSWGETEKAPVLPVQPVPPVQPVRPDTQPAPTPAPETGQEEAFTLTPAEKTWLITAPKPMEYPSENAQWAGFTMLYSLFYWEGELESLKELGIVPTLQRDYQRLYNLADHLEESVVKASTPPPREIPFREEWFNREDNPLKLIAYYDGQLEQQPGNPVCMAYLVRALEKISWEGTARILKKEILSRVHPAQVKAWQSFLLKGGKGAAPKKEAAQHPGEMTGNLGAPISAPGDGPKDLLRVWSPTTDILTAQGAQQFRAYLQEQNQAARDQAQTPGAAGFTYEVAFDFLNRFTTAWRNSPRYFPWRNFTHREVTQMLGKLLGLLRRLKTILAEIRDLKAEAIGPLGEFLVEIAPLVGMMQRLSHTAYELNKPEPLPWYVNGEIKEISDTQLALIVERYGREKQEWVIPRQEFPDENPYPGQMFYAKIKPEQPDKLWDIEPLHVEEESLEDILCDLFGKEAYEKLAALSEKEGS